jgi:hypothetical protein
MYPKLVAQEVAARRPDLGGVAEVLTADPSLTADEVIEILDDATAEWARESQHVVPGVTGATEDTL